MRASTAPILALPMLRPRAPINCGPPIRRPMPLVALLRGANVGSKRFRTKEVVDALEGLEVTSIGAAGTFVVAGKTTPQALAKRILAALPFACEIITVTGSEMLEALEAGRHLKPPKDAKRFATALQSSPTHVALPLEAPAGREWGVRVIKVQGRIALGVRRRVDAGGFYPNEVIEKAFGVKATTRDWATIEKIAACL